MCASLGKAARPRAADVVRNLTRVCGRGQRSDLNSWASRNCGGRTRSGPARLESPAGALEAPALAGVVPEGVPVESCLLRLRGGHVATLRLGYAPQHFPTILVSHLHNYTVQNHDQHSALEESEAAAQETCRASADRSGRCADPRRFRRVQLSAAPTTFIPSFYPLHLISADLSPPKMA